MKKLLFISIFAAAVGLSSCKDFLTVVPSDAMFMNDVQACKQDLASWLTNYRSSSASGSTDAPGPWLPLMMGTKYQAYADVWSFRGWNYNTDTDEWKRLIARAVINERDWSLYYSIIGRMNLVINEVTAAEGDDTMRDYVKGEALMHRAFCFLKLLQYYGHATDASLGVPVYTASDEGFDTKKLRRRSHNEVFARIFADLDEVERLLERTAPRRTYNVMYDADYLYRVRAQAYFWKASGPSGTDDDWRRAASAAQSAIELTGGVLPYDVATVSTKIFGNNTFGVQFVQYEDRWLENDFMGFPETLLYNFNMGSYANYGYKFDLWKELYADNDARKKAWFLETWGSVETATETDLNPTRKFLGFWPTVAFQTMSTFRLAEQYLILAEALAHTDPAAGMQMLRKWQSTRYTGTEAEWPTPAGQDELIDEIRRERKREFVLEGDLLWLDMKRLGTTEPSRGNGSYMAPALTADDDRYQFMIPDSETATNVDIARNPGWEDYRTM